MSCEGAEGMKAELENCSNRRERGRGAPAAVCFARERKKEIGSNINRHLVPLVLQLKASRLSTPLVVGQESFLLLSYQ